MGGGPSTASVTCAVLHLIDQDGTTDQTTSMRLVAPHARAGLSVTENKEAAETASFAEPTLQEAA
eukprot:3875519-Pyramimonas_sp.AAC.1